MQKDLARERAGAPPAERVHLHQEVPTALLQVLPRLLLQTRHHQDQVDRVRMPQREQNPGNLRDRQDLRVRSG